MKFHFYLLLGCLAALTAAGSTRLVEVEVKRKPTDSTWKACETTVLVSGDGPNNRINGYGGNAEVRLEKTGYFHAEKLEDRWHLVDPSGNPLISIGINSVRMGTGEISTAAFSTLYSDDNEWADAATGLLTGVGANTIGAWSDWEVLRGAKRPVPYTIMWNFMSSYGRTLGGVYQQSGHVGYPNDCIFIFNKGFEAFCDTYAEQLASLKDDPYLIGHFSDNEMPLRLNMLDKYLELDAEDEGYQAAVDWLEQRGSSRADLTDAIREDFVEYVADLYFGIVNRAIKRHDPNHLYLGCRFHGSALRLEPLFKAAGRHLDVLSINWYGAWTPDTEYMDNWMRWADRPFIITEFYAKGMDSGMANNSGAGWTVKTQRDRGYFYQNFALGLLAHPNCVGWHWHRYMDNELTAGEDPSNVDSNKGIISTKYLVYEDLVHEMRELNRRANSLRYK